MLSPIDSIPKKLVYLIFLLFILLPSQTLMLNEKLYPSHDGLFHIRRIEQFHQALLEGQVPPRLAPSLVGGAGYPLFIVNYQTPYYLSAIFMQSDGNPVKSFKFVMSATYILSAVWTFLLFKKFASNIASLTGAVVFSYLPYRFANLYQRGSLGESVALMFVPLIFLSMHKITDKSKFGPLLLALSIFGLITSHTIIFLIFLPMIISYLFFMLRVNKIIIKKVTIATMIGILLSSFQLLPSIFEKKYMIFDMSLSELFYGHFINIFQLLRIPNSGVNIGTPIQVGLVSSLILLLSLIYFFTNKDKKVLFFLIFSATSFFLVTKSSLFFWQHTPLLSYALYPWRFLSLLVLSTAFLAVYLIERTKFKIIFSILLIFAVIYTSRHYFLKPAQFEHNLPTNTLATQNEFNTIWSSEETFKDRPLIGSSQKISVSNLSKSTYSVLFGAETSQLTKITIRKMYFPGWQVKVNGQNHSIEIKDGLISFDLPSGSWQIEVKFSESPLRKTANLITVLSFAVLILLFVKKPKFLQS